MARRKQKRNSKVRFVKAATTRRRRRTVGVRTGAFGRKIRRVRVARHPVLVNPRRRKRAAGSKYAYVSNRRRRSRRSYIGNPSFQSIFAKATLKNVGFAVIGLAGTPMAAGFIQRYLPSGIATNRWAGYAIKAGSAWGLSYVTGKVAGKEASRAVLVGGLAYVALGLIQDFFPQILSLGSSVGTGRYLQRQPNLAEYPRLSGARGVMTASTPSRLQSAGRF